MTHSCNYSRKGKYAVNHSAQHISFLSQLINLLMKCVLRLHPKRPISKISHQTQASIKIRGRNGKPVSLGFRRLRTILNFKNSSNNPLNTHHFCGAKQNALFMVVYSWVLRARRHRQLGRMPPAEPVLDAQRSPTQALTQEFQNSGKKVTQLSTTASKYEINSSIHGRIACKWKKLLEFSKFTEAELPF